MLETTAAHKAFVGKAAAARKGAVDKTGDKACCCMESVADVSAEEMTAPGTEIATKIRSLDFDLSG